MKVCSSKKSSNTTAKTNETDVQDMERFFSHTSPLHLAERGDAFQVLRARGIIMPARCHQLMQAIFSPHHYGLRDKIQ
jgi:hypothetical protein